MINGIDGEWKANKAWNFNSVSEKATSRGYASFFGQYYFTIFHFLIQRNQN